MISDEGKMVPPLTKVEKAVMIAMVTFLGVSAAAVMVALMAGAFILVRAL